MTSRALSLNTFLGPNPSPEYSARDENGIKYKKANVYDAVAGIFHCSQFGST
jgi:hypothetical protein